MTAGQGRGRTLSHWLGAHGFQLLGILAICGFFFAWGLAAGFFKIFPYRLVASVAAAGREVLQFPRHTFRIEPEKFKAETKRAGGGVVTHVAGEPSPGLTFLVGFMDGAHGMRLVDLDGRVVHEWRMSFNEIWPEAPHLERQPHDWDTEIHGAVLYPDGDVVFTFQYAGLVRVDRCGRVRWKLPHQTHHSVYRDAQGDLWVPGRELRRTEVSRFPGIKPPFQEEYLLKVSPDGRLLESISVLDIVYRSGYEGLLFANGAHDSVVNPPPDGDFTHLNDIKVLPAELAPAFPSFAPGDLLISLRNLNLIAVLDSRSRRIKWTQVGPYLRQHDPTWLPNGNISVFDNRRDGDAGKRFGGSLIRELDPVSGQPRIRYGSEREDFFYTETMGYHQPLPNGNLLITESNAGRAFEVNGDGEIVWAYVNRWKDGTAGVIAQAIRYPDGYLAPEAIEEKCDDA